MAEFKINGRMKVKTLKENFKKEFQGILRVYNGKDLADDDMTLAAIRSDKNATIDGTLVCRASRTVGKFIEEFHKIYGIKIAVASPDDWILVPDGVTLSKLGKIGKQWTKAQFDDLMSYRRAKDDESEATEYDEIQELSSEYNRVCKNGLWGVINEQNEEVIKCQYEQIEESGEEGFYLVCKNSLWGIANEEGKETVKCQYVALDPFNDKNDDAYDFDALENVEDLEDYLPMFACYETGHNNNKQHLLGFIDHDGNMIIDLSDKNYIATEGFFYAMAIVSDTEGKAAYMNRHGDFVTPFIYSYDDCIGFVYSPFAAIVKRNDKEGIINREGEEVIPCEYSGASIHEDSGDCPEKMEYEAADFDGYIHLFDCYGNETYKYKEGEYDDEE